MKYTKKQIIKGFLNWETDVRLNPSKFNTREEDLAVNVNKDSEDRANILIDYINK